MIQSMARNNAWANGVLNAACQKLSDAEFGAKRSGFFPSLRATMTHIYEVDLYYIDALEKGGAGRSVYGTAPQQASARDLGQLQQAADLQLVAFCDGIDAADLDRSVITERESGPVPERIGDLLPHLFQHQTHHRGQAHAMLSSTDVAPPQLDDFHLTHGRVPAAQAWHDHSSKEPFDVS